MKLRFFFISLLALLAGSCAAGKKNVSSAAATATGFPFIYKEWKQFTVKDGLPNDHIFSVKADADHIWVGTEDGLAVINKKAGKVEHVWGEKDGLPWRVVTAIDISPKTGDVWLALFGGGLARLSGYRGPTQAGRFDHWTQLNSGLVNDVVYGVAVENDNVWAATTAGSSRLNTVTGEWTIFNEKNTPMEEIWNYNVSYNGQGKVFLAIWGSGVLEYDIAANRWKDYLDPDGEMEIDLLRDDGIVHVITTAVSPFGDGFWVSTYFGASRYDGRNWRGYYNMDSGLPSDFINFVKGRSSDEAWFCTDKGLGVITDFATNTWAVYTRDPKEDKGKVVISRDGKTVRTVETKLNVPHNYIIGMEMDGNDVWVATSKGLGWGIGKGYYAGLQKGDSK